MKKIIFIMLFAALSWQQAVAQQFTDGTLWYNVYSGTTAVEVAAKNKAAIGTAIAIPEQVSYEGVDYTVASIGANAFQFDYLLTSVSIPNSIQSIGNGAFKLCYGLTSITIPDSVFRIGNNAFEYCQGLKSVTIGNSVRGIDNSTFYGCSALTAIDIPNSVTSIGTGAFGGCSGLTSVTIPEGVRSIGTDAFNSCSGLKSVTIPSSILYIQERAFFGCTRLTSVVCNIVDPLTINADTFQYSNQSICSLTVPTSSVAAYKAKAVWQNFNAILCDNQTINTTTASACASYTWAVNNQTYTASGVYFSGLSGDCLTEKLDLTLTTVFSDNNVNYVFTSPTTVAVGNNQGAIGNITIPASVTNSCGTYPVTSISDSAFSSSGITSVTIPNSVTQIGAFAFYDCRGLTSVNLPNSAATIGVYTFGNCTSLKSVTANWTSPISIDRNVFEGLNLANIALNIPEGTQVDYNDAAIWTDFNLNGQEIIAGQTIVANGINYVVTKTSAPYEVAVGSNTAIVGVPNLLTEVVSNGNSFAVTSIADQAFYGSQSITGVEIPNSVTRIGSEAFLSCDHLTSLTIGNSLTSIGRGAFEYCTGLTSIMFPNSLTTIEEGAFSRCSGLTSITLPNSLTTFGYGVFQQCTGLTSVTIPNSITSIEGTFYGCTGLTSIIIPDSITNIGDYTFEGCTGLTSVEIPNSVTSIGNGAFSGCSSLLSISIGNSVTSIGNGAFSRCSSLASFTIPNALTSIANSTFSGCSSLTSITIPNTVTSIEGDAFASCSALTSVTIPSSVTSIGGSAFYRCSGLTTVTIPNSVTSIEGNAFWGCQALKSVTVNWTTPLDIDSTVFADIYTKNVSLFVPAGTEVVYGQTGYWQYFNINGREVVTGQTFTVNGFNYSVNKGTLPYEVALLGSTTTITGALTIPKTVTHNGNSFAVTVIGAAAFYGHESLTSVTIPNSIYRIHEEAFAGCFNLTEITVNWTTPIQLGGKSGYPFEEKMVPSITLNVPAGTKATYQKSWWSDFNIVEPVTTIFNYCRNAVATPLVAPFATGSTVKWYTVATGGRALTTVPTPLTTTVGTKLFYVSQVVGGVESARETITVNTIALPATPATITGTASQGALVGTYATANYSIANVADAVSYVWTAPTGVNIVEGQGTNSVTVNFADVPTGAGAIGNLSVLAVNSNDCRSSERNLALTKALPDAPDAIKMTDDALPIPVSGVATAVTSFAKYMGTDAVLKLTATAVATASSYEWELPEGVTQLSGGTSNEITVNFAGVASNNTYKYTTTAGVLTHVLRIGVKAINGAGSSVTTNNTAIEPTTSSTARLLTLNAVLPAAPSAIKMTDAAALDPDKTVTVISNFIGTTKELTLTATPSAAASSYSWELPAGVNQRSGGNSNVITVDFAGVGSGITTLYIGVKSVNGIGTSVTTNVAPNAASTAKLLKLTATIPGAVTAVSGQITNLCGNSSYNYTITPSSLATSYLITAPAGSVVQSASNMSNTNHTLSTSDVSFMVTYPNGFLATKAAPKSIVVTAVNGVGSSLANRTLALSTLVPAIGTPIGGTTFQRASTQVFSVPAIEGVTTYTWTVADGAVITAGQGTNSITVNFSAVPLAKTTNKLTVVATNACGISSGVRVITLRSVVSSARNAAASTLAIRTTEVYPNPVPSNFNIDVTASTAGTLTIATYSLDGILVSSIKTVALKAGTNTITENVAGLKTGVYILQLVNTSNNEVITKKLIKE